MKTFTRLLQGILMISTLILAGQLTAQQNTSLLGRWADGPCRAIDISSSTAIYGNGGYLVAADVSDPSNPVAFSSVTLQSTISDIKINNGYAYVANDRAGFRIFNISDPQQIIETGFIDDTNNIYATRKVVLYGDYAYLSGFFAGMRIIDVSNPEQPHQTGLFNTSSNITAITGSGNYIYLSSGGNDFQVLDVSTPLFPFLIGKINYLQAVKAITINGNYAYLTDHNGLHIVDISEADSPVETGLCNLNHTESVAVTGNYAYVAKQYEGFYVVDISNPENPIIADTLFTDYSVNQLIINGSSAYCSTTGNGVRIFDVSSPENPHETGFMEGGDVLLSLRVKEDKAYLANGSSGLQIIDISDPAGPVAKGSVNMETFATDVDVAGNYAYVCESRSGLHIIDVSSADNPIENGFYELGGYKLHLLVKDNYAYICNDGFGLSIIDISSPSNPVLTGSLELVDVFGSINNLAIGNNYAYVYLASKGIAILDISDPSSPAEIGFLEATGYYGNFDLALDSNYLFWTGVSPQQGFQIVDVSSPENPQIVSGLPGNYNKLRVSGNFAYVGSEDWVDIFDISDKTNPVKAGRQRTGGYTEGIDVVNNMFYVADASAGLYLVKNDLISGVNPALAEKSFDLLQNFPNPFKESTTFNYQLSRSEIVNLQLIDVNGKVIETLVNEQQSPGKYWVRWNNSKLPSGVYFYRLSAGNYHETKQCVVLE